MWLLAEGPASSPLGKAGCPSRFVRNGVDGTAFAVWAPNARRVAVVGDFNRWNGAQPVMHHRMECGVGSSLRQVSARARCTNSRCLGADGLSTLKTDPYALRTEPGSGHAVLVMKAARPVVQRPPGLRDGANALTAPMGIYEVHVGSWRRPHGQLPDWALSGTDPGALCGGPGVHPPRAVADQRASVLRFVGLPTDRSVCANGPLWHARGVSRFVDDGS